ncbi:MAG: transglutaminase domain-containing protein [Pirellulaceae bacterium]
MTLEQQFAGHSLPYLNFKCLLLTGGILAVAAASGWAQVPNNASSNDPSEPAVVAADGEVSPLQYIAPKSIEMQVGVQIVAGDGNMLNTIAMTVFPTDWPEQTVEVVEVNVPPALRYSFRDLPHNNRQLLFESQMIPGGSRQLATIKVRIEKKHIVGPEDTTAFVIPRRTSRDIRNFLGNSPYIEADAGEIRKIVREVDETQPLNDWKRVEALYDWVRDNIEYENGELKTVREALKDRKGDCEEMTSTFVALCRAAKVPARMVWIPNHCYPEFYLEDSAGEGYWFPCQVAGTRNFGSMPEYLPILQKGDRFKVPEKREVQRYLADYLKSGKVLGRTNPQVEFVRQLLGDAANLRSPDLGGAENP